MAASAVPYRRLSGWRRAVAVNTYIISLVFIFLVSLLFYCCVQAKGLQSWVFFTATCQSTGQLNLLIHLVINILSTIVLGSSNFFMQILSSPTRADVDKRHSMGIWLNIGIPSVRNLRLLPTRRVVCWLLFLLSSFPIHMLSNSAVFPAQYIASGYTTLVAHDSIVDRVGLSLQQDNDPDDASFQVCSDINQPKPQPWAAPIAANATIIFKDDDRWENIEIARCRQILSSRQSLVTYQTILLSVHGQCESTLNIPNAPGDCLSIVSCGSDPSNPWCLSGACEGYATSLTPERLSIDSCFVEKAEDRCKLGVSNVALLVVLACMAVKCALCHFVTTFMLSEKPLATIGDAINSFIVEEDPATARGF
ncbi:hypothetical protein GQ53DRAFT_818775 [Thozetella sp. PMI_491]|nr:hypothetical protein GQ53DRAFT_818775 [Thozetella sp. PMI_491]